MMNQKSYCSLTLTVTNCHEGPLQLVLNAAAHLDVKKRKWDNIILTICDIFTGFWCNSV